MPKFTQFEKLALFAGNDWFTRMLLSKLLPSLHDIGYRPYVYSVGRKSLNRQLPDKLTEFYLYERKLLETASTILDTHPIQENVSCFSLNGLAKKYDVQVEEVANVNAKDFLEKLHAEGIKSALSVRCLQVFKTPFISLFKEGFLWNLHSAALPECKGAMPLFWTVYKEKPPQLTLHTIKEGIDEGDIIDVNSFTIKPKHSLLEIMISDELIGKGETLILNALEKQKSGLISPLSQKGKGEYFTYPTKEDLDEFSLKYQLVSPEMIDLLVKRVCPEENTILAKELKAAFNVCIEQFDNSSNNLTRNRFFQRGESPHLKRSSDFVPR